MFCKVNQKRAIKKVVNQFNHEHSIYFYQIYVGLHT